MRHPVHPERKETDRNERGGGEQDSAFDVALPEQRDSEACQNKQPVLLRQCGRAENCGACEQIPVRFALELPPEEVASRRGEKGERRIHTN